MTDEFEDYTPEEMWNEFLEWLSNQSADFDPKVIYDENNDVIEARWGNQGSYPDFLNNDITLYKTCSGSYTIGIEIKNVAARLCGECKYEATGGVGVNLGLCAKHTLSNEDSIHKAYKVEIEALRQKIKDLESGSA